MSESAELQPVAVDDLPPKKAPTRWRRRIADVVFGVIAPILSLIFDPIVFRGDAVYLTPALPQYRVFAYAAIPMGVMVLTLWLWRRSRLRVWSGFLAGVLFVGALFSLLIGVLLLPTTLLGLLLGIGVLGFIPFITAIVFLRNGYDALNSASKALNVKGVVASFMIGMVVGISIPGVLHLGAATYVDEGIGQIVSGDVEAGTQQLQNAFWCQIDCFTALEIAHKNETDSIRREQISSAYQGVTGRDINWRAFYYSD